jgi:hypothetical protein
MSEAKETVSGSSDEIRCSGAEGLPRGDDFNVQGTADLRLAAEEIERMLRRARRTSVDYSAMQDAVAMAKVTQAAWALDIAHSILIAAIKDKELQREGTKPNS